MTTEQKSGRKVIPVQVRVEPQKVQTTPEWLNERADRFDLTTALAHNDDGVNWGFFESGAWHWSHEAFSEVSPLFRWETLQQLRCFGKTAELFVWRTAEGFAGRVIEEVNAGANGSQDISDCIEEDVMLWGQGGTSQGRFALMQEGQRGLRHAPPQTIVERGRVTFRHYLKDDDDGCARVVASRLVGK